MNKQTIVEKLAEEIRNDLFEVTDFQSITTVTGDWYKKSYKQISDIDFILAEVKSNGSEVTLYLIRQLGVFGQIQIYIHFAGSKILELRRLKEFSSPESWPECFVWFSQRAKEIDIDIDSARLIEVLTASTSEMLDQLESNLPDDLGMDFHSGQWLYNIKSCAKEIRENPDGDGSR